MLLRRYILYIIIGVSLIACDRQSHPNAPETVEQAIGMAPTSVAATRALISDTEGLQREGFVVYGYKETPSSGTQVFTHQAVNYNNRWGYTPTRYWDRAASYYFGAFSPQTIDTNHQGTGKATHTILIEAPHWQVIDGNEVDIVVATSHDEAENYLDLQGGVVDLAFEHILSQLEVQIVRNALLTNEYRLTKLAYNAVPTDNATATYTLDYTTPSNSAMSTVPTAEKIAYSNAKGVVVSSEVKGETTFKYLVVPFNATTDGGLQIVVSYTVNGGTPKQSTVKTGLATLEAGKRYVLKLTFDSGLDIIPELEIADWEEQEIDEDPKYNW